MGILPSQCVDGKAGQTGTVAGSQGRPRGQQRGKIVEDETLKPQIKNKNLAVIVAAIFIGGMLGTYLRVVADLLLAQPNQHLSLYLTFSGGLFLVNLAGAFLLGYFGAKWEYLGFVEKHAGMDKGWHEPLRLGVTTGIFGALTSYSSLSLLVFHNHIILDMMALISLFTTGIGIAGWGRRLARRRYPKLVLPQVKTKSKVRFKTKAGNLKAQSGGRQ